MNLINISTTLNLASQRFALMWAKEHLPEEQYNEIKKSYDLLMKRTAAFVIICCIPIIILCSLLIIYTPFSKNIENTNIPNGATDYVMARVDYDGNFYWTNDSQKYEYALEDYGLHKEDFEFGDKVKVYINNYQNIIEVTTNTNVTTIKNIEIGVGCICTILIPVLLIICVFRPIAYRTFGKSWIEFYRNFDVYKEVL